MNKVNRDKLHPNRTDPSQAGFTLIELLVAMTLLGLLSIALLGGLRFGTRVWETGHERSDAFYEIETVHEFLRKQLSQARVLTQPPSRRDNISTFVGTAEQLVFVAPFPEFVGLGGLYRFELTYNGDDDNGKMVLSWELYRADRPSDKDEESISRRLLVEGLEALQISYYGALDPNTEASWHQIWDAGGRLPLLIALNLKFPEKDTRNWPVLVVAPFAAQNEL